jgi:hypothetical protein
MLNEVPRPTNVAIANRLEREFAAEPHSLKAGPTAKAIGEWIKNGWIAVTDVDAAWTLFDSQPEDAPRVLEVVRELGLREWPSKRTAEWIVRLRRAFPDLRPSDAHYIARYAVIYASPTNLLAIETLNAWLTYTPWLDDGAALIAEDEKNAVPHSAVWIWEGGPGR